MWISLFTIALIAAVGLSVTAIVMQDGEQVRF